MPFFDFFRRKVRPSQALPQLTLAPPSPATPSSEPEKLAFEYMDQLPNSDHVDSFVTLVLAWLDSPDLPEKRRFLIDHVELITARSTEIITHLIAQQGGQLQKQQDLYLAREVIHYLHERGNTTVLIQDAYVNAYGGFVLSLPDWLQAIIDADQLTLQSERPDLMAPTRAANWQESLTRAQVEHLALPICATIAITLNSCLRDIRSTDSLRINEDRIQVLTLSLQLYTQAAYPYQWAKAQIDLGTAYRDRILGSKEENIDDAIACYEQAISTCTQDAFPVQWAIVQNNLGLAFYDRSVGSRKENLERSIACYESALQVFTRDTFPVLWATTQNNLGNTYADRIAGSQAENVERSIACFEAALLVRTQDAFPEYWASTQGNLGLSYRDRITGSRAENIERSIVCFEAALLILTRDAFPYDWARAQNNLGNTYSERILGSRAESIERSIAYYKAALQVHTQDAFPYDWARTQNNLGASYVDRMIGNRAENLEYAIACFEATLQVRTRDIFPHQWALTMSYLGNAYRDRLEGNKTENLERAIYHYDASLQVHTSDAFPQECERTLLNAVLALGELRRWPSMREHLREALAIENLRFAEASDLHSQEAILQEGRDVALQAAAVSVQMGDLSDALVTVEAGRARSLAQSRQLALADPSRINNPKRHARYLSAREDLTTMQAELRRVVGGLDYLEQLARYYQCKHDFDELIAEIEAEHDPADFLHQHITLDDIWQAVACGSDGHALVYLMPTAWGGFALGAFAPSSVLSNSRRILTLPLPHLKPAMLEMLLHVKSSDIHQHRMGGYILAQEGRIFELLISWPGDTLRQKVDAIFAATHGESVSLLAVAARLALALPNYQHMIDEPINLLDAGQTHRFANAIDHVFLQLEIQRSQEWLSESVLRPLVAWLRDENVRSVTLIPCGQLAAFPLLTTPVHAINEEIETFGDLITASVAPSALSLLHGDRINTLRAGVATLGNPLPSRQPLEWSEAEALEVALLGGDKERCRLGLRATRDWFIEQASQVRVFDASCHGLATGEDFLSYRLNVANGEVVTLRDALDGIANLHGLRLLILSACQTGIINIRGATSEMRSLAVGFLQAGANAVMGALWSVDDLATYLLMVRFAQEWFPVIDHEPPAAALVRAQRWLRTVTWADLLTWSSRKMLPTITAVPDVAPDDVQQNESSVAAAQHVYAIRRADTPNMRDAIDIDMRGLRMDEAMAASAIAIRAQQRSHMHPDKCPFADSYYWAAFQITGW